MRKLDRFFYPLIFFIIYSEYPTIQYCYDKWGITSFLLWTVNIDVIKLYSDPASRRGRWLRFIPAGNTSYAIVWCFWYQKFLWSRKKVISVSRYTCMSSGNSYCYFLLTSKISSIYIVNSTYILVVHVGYSKRQLDCYTTKWDKQWVYCCIWGTSL